jgi:hypothetical protein
LVSGQVPGSRLTMLEGEGHLSLPMNRTDEILGELLAP